MAQLCCSPTCQCCASVTTSVVLLTYLPMLCKCYHVSCVAHLPANVVQVLPRQLCCSPTCQCCASVVVHLPATVVQVLPRLCCSPTCQCCASGTTSVVLFIYLPMLCKCYHVSCVVHLPANVVQVLPRQLCYVHGVSIPVSEALCLHQVSHLGSGLLATR